MGFIDQRQLQALCAEGQFKHKPTVTAETSRFDEDSDTVMVVLVHLPDGEKIGTCAAPHIPSAIEAFKNSIENCYHNEDVPNPNIEQLEEAFHLACKFHMDAKTFLHAEHRRDVRSKLRMISTVRSLSKPTNDLS